MAAPAKTITGDRRDHGFSQCRNRVRTFIDSDFVIDALLFVDADRAELRNDGADTEIVSSSRQYDGADRSVLRKMRENGGEFAPHRKRHGIAYGWSVQ